MSETMIRASRSAFSTASAETAPLTSSVSASRIFSFVFSMKSAEKRSFSASARGMPGVTAAPGSCSCPPETASTSSRFIFGTKSSAIWCFSI